MGRVDDIIIQAQKDLLNANLLDRPDYIDLYSGGENAAVVQLLATLHYHYVSLFDTMNARLPTGEHGAHFWADPSRDLIRVIDVTNLLLNGLKDTEYSFEIEAEFKSFVNICRQFLSGSGGSSIPPHTPKAPIYYTRQIFLSSTSVQVASSVSDKRNLKTKMIGSGSYANVYRFRDDFYGRDFVLKVAKKDLSESDKVRFRNEYVVMKGLSSPYVAEVYKYFEGKDEFIMESLDETLYQYVSSQNDKATFNVEIRRRLCLQVMKAFEYIHEKQILHRDISPYNILIKKYEDSVVVKIADLGLVKIPESVLTNSQTEIKGCCNDPQLRHVGYSNYSLPHEIYAITVIIKFILTGSMNICNVKDDSLREFVMKGTNPELDKRYSNVTEMRKYFQLLRFSGCRLY